MTDRPAIRPGTFVVRTREDTRTGLAAHEVVELLAADPLDVIEVHRIHRVLPDNRMELVGVSLREFERRDGVVFPRKRVADARRDYDAIASAAKRLPPPCRVDLQLAHFRSQTGDTVHLTALIFPLACADTIHAWLAEAGIKAGDATDGLPMAYGEFEASAPQIVMRQSLEC